MRRISTQQSKAWATMGNEINLAIILEVIQKGQEQFGLVAQQMEGLAEAAKKASEVFETAGEKLDKTKEKTRETGEEAKEARTGIHGFSDSLKELSEELENTSSHLRNVSQGLIETGEKMEEFGQKIGETYLEMARKSAENAEELQHLSEQTGMSVQALSRWQAVAELSGVSAETLQMGFRHMARSIDEATRSAEGQDAFRRLGVNISTLLQENPEDRFRTLALAISNVHDPTERAALAMQIFGRTGDEMIPLFAHGAKGLEEMEQKADELGGTVDSQTNKNLSDMADAFNEVQVAMGGLARSIGSDLAPVLTPLMKDFATVLTHVKDLIDKCPVGARAVIGLSVAVGGLVALGGGVLVLAGHFVQLMRLLESLPDLIRIVRTETKGLAKDTREAAAAAEEDAVAEKTDAAAIRDRNAAENSAGGSGSSGGNLGKTLVKDGEKTLVKDGEKALLKDGEKVAEDAAVRAGERVALKAGETAAVDAAVKVGEKSAVKTFGTWMARLLPEMLGIDAIPGVGEIGMAGELAIAALGFAGSEAIDHWGDIKGYASKFSSGAGGVTHHVVHIVTDGRLGKDHIDERIRQFALGFHGATVHS